VLPYLRKTSLSKEGFSTSGFILSVALFLNKNPNANGALFPNFVPKNVFSWWFLPRLCSSLIFYRGDALRKTSLSKEGFSTSGFILSVALFLNKNPNVNGALFPNFVPENVFSWWFLPRLCSSLIFYRGDAPHWFFTEVMLLMPHPIRGGPPYRRRNFTTTPMHGIDAFYATS